jgi:hypothetical protein
MIPSLPINEHCQTYSCWLAARHSQARIHTLNSHTAALANTPHSPQRVHSHQLAHTVCTRHFLSLPLPLACPNPHSLFAAPLPCGSAIPLPPDAISCLGAFQPPVIGARGKVVLAGG